MSKVERFEDLKCWQAARALVKLVYEISNEGAMSKDFSFKDQIRRASISTMNNIAEGFGRKSSKEFIRYLEISFTSANEVRSLLYATIDIGYLSEEQASILQGQAEAVKAMNLALIKYLRSSK